jgi:putative flippase GtrA
MPPLAGVISLPRLARPGRYGAIGLLCACAHNAIMICGDAYGLHHVPANMLSFALVGSLGYCLHSRWTFRKPLRVRSYVSFMAGLLLGFLMSVLLMIFACDVLRMPVWAAAPLTTLLLLLFNYASARWSIAGASG